MSVRTLLCDGWEFSKNPIDTDYSDSLDWKRVDIPHDWLIYDTKNLYETSTGWYRRDLDYKKTGERISIRFEGVYMDSRVYVNGVLAGEWKYGYSTFEFDITDLLRDGENLIAVRVDHREPNSRWYSGAGIYRRVWLKTYPDCHLTADGIYVSASADGTITVTAETERPDHVRAAELSVRHIIMDGEKEIARLERSCCAVDRSRVSQTVLRDGCSYSVNTDSLKIENPVLWDIEQAKLYSCVTELVRNGEVIDREENRFGIRTIQFTPDSGFFLNGRHVKLHGSCEHHDLGALGAAVNRTAIKRRLDILRTMGVNAIRTSHNMPAVELMELADEMGFLILSEGFDMWEMPKTEYDYARFFPEWISRDVASWVRRDRNHPSIIGWSIGNEIYDTHASERGQEVTSLLVGFVREHDPRCNGYVTIGSNFMQGENAQKCADIVKLAGYNYAERLYEEQHRQHPDWMIYGSETASVIQSRGIYHFPLSQSVLADDDEQCSALGNCTTGWGAKNTEFCIIADRDAEYCAGQFIWTGFDYIGEPTPYSTKNSYFGQIDTAGFPKDSAYIFRAEWTDYKKSPFVHLFPYWDFTEGQEIDVRVTSNAPRVKLLFNGETVGEKEIDHAHGTELTLDTILEYKKGELCAIAYDENGNEIARDVKRSFGDAAYVKLTPDRTEMNADGTDLIFIDISAFDENGEWVANANNRAFVTISGAGRLVGLDNGDSTDYEPYKGISRRLFSGKLLAIVAAKTEAGEMEVKVSSPGLPDSRLVLHAVPTEVPVGVSADEENALHGFDCADPELDIPVRKIELVGESTVFNADCREISFKTLVSPANASYADEIEYRMTTVLGIESNLAEITSVENGVVTVRCSGDGEFYLRALCKNGTEKYHILSALKLSGEGIGAAAFNPYELVMGGLATVSSGNIGNGIQHGAAFARESSWFGFENVDFGPVGSDTVTVPIFANTAYPVQIKFYDGIPGKGGELIGDFSYHKKSIWLTYIPETYKLSKVLKGMHTLVMESSDGYDIQGFRFDKREKEFAEICAVDNENIYGDKFTVGVNDVTGIGNNVMLNFGEFDFSEHSPSALMITGKSALPLNSIHVIFGGSAEKRIIAEFKGADDYTPREFSLEGITGKCKVSFVFLPGSDFDFKSFQFVR
ncbi:glycoside hydrolase family 2 TIM barrel-domain containing protein [Gorillibacterium timonense]|uniref:glycoside hydrolase family 2 TIM barrel-domain containing protein n=1 Tax=Gorillibacterium timonense TaxID=1689269 RepID=UPI00071D660C|nr:glycoside hydrolase family 2 TIM barrel-domain containing protein [Gorillibacterium timonense]